MAVLKTCQHTSSLLGKTINVIHVAAQWSQI